MKKFSWFVLQHTTLGKNNGLITLEKMRIVATFINILKEENVQKRSIKIYFPWGNIISACMINLQHLKDSLKRISLCDQRNKFLYVINSILLLWDLCNKANKWLIYLTVPLAWQSIRLKGWREMKSTDVQEKIDCTLMLDLWR